MRHSKKNYFQVMESRRSREPMRRIFPWNAYEFFTEYESLQDIRKKDVKSMPQAEEKQTSKVNPQENLYRLFGLFELNNNSTNECRERDCLYNYVERVNPYFSRDTYERK